MPPAGETVTLDGGFEVEVDQVITKTPPLRPRWTRSMVGVSGTKTYIDFRLCVWEHAAVSLLAFATLALLSNPV